MSLPQLFVCHPTVVSHQIKSVGVTMTCADVPKGDAMGSVVVFLRRPVFIPGTMLVTTK